jgi:hypothetical protein
MQYLPILRVVSLPTISHGARPASTISCGLLLSFLTVYNACCKKYDICWR